MTPWHFVCMGFLCTERQTGSITPWTPLHVWCWLYQIDTAPFRVQEERTFCYIFSSKIVRRIWSVVRFRPFTTYKLRSSVSLQNKTLVTFSSGEFGCVASKCLDCAISGCTHVTTSVRELGYTGRDNVVIRNYILCSRAINFIGKSDCIFRRVLQMSVQSAFFFFFVCLSAQSERNFLSKINRTNPCLVFKTVKWHFQKSFCSLRPQTFIGGGSFDFKE
jgi:hypothetical protein